MSWIYIAAPWKDKALMPEIAAKFEAAGHKITWKWWATDDIAEGNRNEDALQTQALNDVNGVLDADVLVLINTAKSEGKAVEQGIAIASGIPIIAVGKRGDGTSLNVFHYLSVYDWTEDVEGAIVLLEEYAS
jgi:nucleoside 2-deoxyribosyltransferase